MASATRDGDSTGECTGCTIIGEKCGGCGLAKFAPKEQDFCIAFFSLYQELFCCTKAVMLQFLEENVDPAVAGRFCADRVEELKLFKTGSKAGAIGLIRHLEEELLSKNETTVDLRTRLTECEEARARAETRGKKRKAPGAEQKKKKKGRTLRSTSVRSQDRSGKRSAGQQNDDRVQEEKDDALMDDSSIDTTREIDMLEEAAKDQDGDAGYFDGYDQSAQDTSSDQIERNNAGSSPPDVVGTEDRSRKRSEAEQKDDRVPEEIERNNAGSSPPDVVGTESPDEAEDLHEEPLVISETATVIEEHVSPISSARPHDDVTVSPQNLDEIERNNAGSSPPDVVGTEDQSRKRSEAEQKDDKVPEEENRERLIQEKGKALTPPGSADTSTKKVAKRGRAPLSMPLTSGRFNDDHVIPAVAQRYWGVASQDYLRSQLSFGSLEVGLSALFCRKSTGHYAALNYCCDHYYLSKESARELTVLSPSGPGHITGKVVRIDGPIVSSSTINPYDLPVGTVYFIVTIAARLPDEDVPPESSRQSTSNMTPLPRRSETEANRERLIWEKGKALTPRGSADTSSKKSPDKAEDLDQEPLVISETATVVRPHDDATIAPQNQSDEQIERDNAGSSPPNVVRTEQIEHDNAGSSPPNVVRTEAERETGSSRMNVVIAEANRQRLIWKGKAKIEKRLKCDRVATFIMNDAGHYEARDHPSSQYYLSDESIRAVTTQLPPRIIGDVVLIEPRIVGSSTPNPYDLPLDTEYFVVTLAQIPNLIAQIPSLLPRHGIESEIGETSCVRNGTESPETCGTVIVDDGEDEVIPSPPSTHAVRHDRTNDDIFAGDHSGDDVLPYNANDIEEGMDPTDLESAQLAHALSLSLKTAEQEKAMREKESKSIAVSECDKPADSNRRQFRSEMGSSSIQDEAEDLDKEQLVCRRRIQPISSVSETATGIEEHSPLSSARPHDNVTPSPQNQSDEIERNNAGSSPPDVVGTEDDDARLRQALAMSVVNASANATRNPGVSEVATEKEKVADVPPLMREVKYLDRSFEIEKRTRSNGVQIPGRYKEKKLMYQAVKKKKQVPKRCRKRCICDNPTCRCSEC